MKTKKAIKLIKKYTQVWGYRLGLRWWNLDLVFFDDPNSILENFGGNGDRTVLAVTYVDWQYAKAKLLFNVPAFSRLDKWEIENAVLHELCHVLVHEMREGEIHHEERVVTGLQKAFKWTEIDSIRPKEKML